MRVAVALLSVALAAVALAQAPERGGALPSPLPLFPPDNWWNTDVSAAPVDPGSAAFINYIGATRGLHPDFGGDSGDPDHPIYGMPYIVVRSTQPLVPVTFEYDDESDLGAPGRPPGYPIPEEAKTQQKWIEGGLAGNDPRAEGDRHMLMSTATLGFCTSSTPFDGPARGGRRDQVPFSRSIRTLAVPMDGPVPTRPGWRFFPDWFATTRFTVPNRSDTRSA